MKPFTFQAAADAAAAVAAAATAPDAAFLAGGTTLVDLMRLEVMTPPALIGIARLPLAEIAEDTGGGLRIGAMVRNSDVAHHPLVAERYPVLAEAILAGASPQVRNMATVGGNLLQRTRCPYFRDLASACNKRAPGSGCAAIGGHNRSHAILGGSKHCIATHPSDMCVALAALDASVHVRGPSGERVIPFGELHTLPGDHPEIESTLAIGELITAVSLPAAPFARRSRYVKLRDRAAFAFALASAAVALHVEGGKVRAARIALGGVGTRPWRAPAAENALIGQRPDAAHVAAAAAAALTGADPQPGNRFKVALARGAVIRALTLAAGAP